MHTHPHTHSHSLTHKHARARTHTHTHRRTPSLLELFLLYRLNLRRYSRLNLYIKAKALFRLYSSSCY